MTYDEAFMYYAARGYLAPHAMAAAVALASALHWQLPQQEGDR